MGATDSKRERMRQAREVLTSRIRLPMVSGKASAAALLACFALTGLFIPMTVHEPVWIDIEFVLLGWWVLWTAALAFLLYGGRRVTDDHQLPPPRNWFGALKGTNTSTADGATGCLDLGSLGFEAEGCMVGVGVVIGIILLFIGAWFLIEIAFPMVAFVMYVLLRSMLAKVANDRHQCKGNVIFAICWGAFWATVYTAPLGLLVWVVHLVAAKAAVG